jgi:hypothetical protein
MSPWRAAITSRVTPPRCCACLRARRRRSPCWPEYFSRGDWPSCPRRTDHNGIDSCPGILGRPNQAGLRAQPEPRANHAPWARTTGMSRLPAEYALVPVALTREVDAFRISCSERLCCQAVDWLRLHRVAGCARGSDPGKHPERAWHRRACRPRAASLRCRAPTVVCLACAERMSAQQCTI